MAITMLSAPATAGDTTLHVSSNDGFHPGTHAVIGTSDGLSETILVVSLGSLLLKSPLIHSYSAGVLVTSSVKAETLLVSSNTKVQLSSMKSLSTNQQTPAEYCRYSAPSTPDLKAMHAELGTFSLSHPLSCTLPVDLTHALSRTLPVALSHTYVSCREDAAAAVCWCRL